MPVRRLNYTGRRRIGRDDVDIRVKPASHGAPASFDAKLTLSEYGLPQEARVSVEAYRQTAFMRFDFGTIERTQQPRYTQLHAFDNSEAILFRVKVTSASDPRGVLLAEADRIPLLRENELQNEELKSPLLPVKPESLGDEIWRLDFTDRPLLLINDKASDWRAVVRSKAFASLVYPAVLREILIRILRVEAYNDTDDDSDWKALWLRFSQLLPGAGPVPQKGESDQFDDWIDDAVRSFARQVNALDRFTSFWNDEVVS